jgi:hypothetical protein
MIRSGLLVCHAPSSEKWALGPLPPARGAMTLVGWHMATEPTDGGIPGEIAMIVAAAMVAVAQVNFPASPPRKTDGAESVQTRGDLVSPISAAGLLERTRDRLAGRSAVWVSTRQVASVFALFDDAGFPWWLGQQIALLSAPGIALPPVDRAQLLGLIEPNWAARAAAMPDVAGAVRAGVDGDIFGFLACDPDFSQAFLSALADAAAVAGYDWIEQTEAEFGRR